MITNQIDDNRLSKIGDLAGSTDSLISPFGLYTLLSLLATGLSAESRCQFELILKRVFDDVQLDNQLSLLIDTLLSPSFCMSTFVLVEKQLSLNTTFTKRAKSVFHADIGIFDASIPQAPISIITDQMDDLACGNYDHLMKRIGFAADTPLMLVNTVQLRAKWQQAFPFQSTVEGDFFTDDENARELPPRRVPMMRLVAHLPYVKHNTFTSIDLCLHSELAKKTKMVNAVGVACVIM